VIGDIVRVIVPGFALGAAIMAATNRKLPRAAASARWLKLAVFCLIVLVVLAAAEAGTPWIMAVLLLVLGAGAGELWRAWRRIAPRRPVRIWLVFLPAALLVLWNGWNLPPSTFAFLFVVTAACDGFSQVIGQWLGRRPMAPRISPGKTIGGLVGGLCAAAVVAMLMRDLLQTSAPDAAACGLLIGIAALFGDIAASWVKRCAAIKDYSSALPGQGGFLDRFDSLLGAMAIAGSALLATGLVVD
jgi:phosphatidate cytidylyltransferase